MVARDEAAAGVLRRLRTDPQNGIGREVPMEEYARFPSTLPPHPQAAFEPADHVMFSIGQGTELFSKPQEIGNHGHWPTRYRSVFLLWGPDIPHRTLEEFSIKEIAHRLAEVIGVALK